MPDTQLFEPLFEVFLDDNGSVSFAIDDSAFYLKPDEVVALMQIIRPHQDWDDAHEQTLSEPWYKAFRKLKETELYKQGVLSPNEALLNGLVETNWLVRGILLHLGSTPKEAIEAAMSEMETKV